MLTFSIESDQCYKYCNRADWAQHSQDCKTLACKYARHTSPSRKISLFYCAGGMCANKIPGLQELEFGVLDQQHTAYWRMLVKVSLVEGAQILVLGGTAGPTSTNTPQ